MKRKYIFIFLAIIILAGVGIWYANNRWNKKQLPAGAPWSSLSLPPASTPTLPPASSPYSLASFIARVTYACNNDKTIDASFYRGEPKPVKPGEPPIPSGSVTLVLSDGRNLDLPQTISADGLRYANSNESFIFWSKGNSALVLEGKAEKDYIGCVVPKKP